MYLHLSERSIWVLLCSFLLDPCYHGNCQCVRREHRCSQSGTRNCAPIGCLLWNLTPSVIFVAQVALLYCNFSAVIAESHGTVGQDGVHASFAVVLFRFIICWLCFLQTCLGSLSDRKFITLTSVWPAENVNHQVRIAGAISWATVTVDVLESVFIPHFFC